MADVSSCFEDIFVQLKYVEVVFWPKWISLSKDLIFPLSLR